MVTPSDVMSAACNMPFVYIGIGFILFLIMSPYLKGSFEPIRKFFEHLFDDDN